MKLVYFYTRSLQILVVCMLICSSHAFAQPEIPGGDQDTVPFFGTNDNDPMGLQVPGGNELVQLYFSELLLFANDINAGDDEVTINLTFRDSAGNALDLVTPYTGTNTVSYSFDLSALPFGTQVVTDSKNYYLAFDPTCYIDAPTGYLADPSLQTIYIDYEVWTKPVGGSHSTLLLGQTSDAFLTMELIPDRSGGNKRVANPSLAMLPTSETPIAYPNPTATQFTLDIPITENVSPIIQLFDQNGRQIPLEVRSMTATEEKISTIIDIQALRPGIYLCKVSGYGIESRVLRISKIE